MITTIRNRDGDETQQLCLIYFIAERMHLV